MYAYRNWKAWTEVTELKKYEETFRGDRNTLNILGGRWGRGIKIRKTHSPEHF